MVAELLDALKNVERDGEVRAVVLTGAGKHFCAGQDLTPLLVKYQSAEGVHYGEHLRRTFNVIIAKMRTIEKPFIGAINGAAAGAGLGVALACDLRHGSETAKFRMAFIGIGLAPDAGTSFFLPRIVGLARATEMALTNELIDATQAFEYGLVNRVFKADELMPKTLEFARQLAHAPTKAIGLTKRAFNRALAADLESTLEYEAFMQETAGHSEDHREGVRAFLEKRAPQFKGK